MSEKKKSFFKKANKNAAPENLSAEERTKAADVEQIVSPMRQIVNNFFERKLAVGALVLLIVMLQKGNKKEKEEEKKARALAGKK